MSENGLTRVLFLSATKKWRSAETSTIARLMALGEITADTPVRESMIEPGVPAAVHPATRIHFSDEDRARFEPEPEPEPEVAADPLATQGADAVKGEGDPTESHPEVDLGSQDGTQPPASAYAVSGQFRVGGTTDEAADSDIEPKPPEPPKIKKPKPAPAPAAARSEPAAAEMKAPAPARRPVEALPEAPPSSEARVVTEPPPWKILAGVGVASAAILLALSFLNNLGESSTVQSRPAPQQMTAQPARTPAVAEHRAFMRRASELRSEPSARSPQRASVSRGIEVVRLGPVRQDGWARIRLPNRTEGYVRASALGDNAAPRLAVGSELSRRTVTAGSTLVVTTPDGSTRMAVLSNGQTVQVAGALQDRRDWAEVILDDGRVGYIPMRSLQRAVSQAAPTPAPRQAAVAATQPQSSSTERPAFARVAATIHSDASATARQITRAARGTSLTQIGEPGATGWVRVRTAEGLTGWMRTIQLSDTRPPVLDGAGAQQLTVTAPAARVYRRVGGEAFAELPSGRLVTVAGRLRSQTDWAEVILPNGDIGYMQMTDFAPRTARPAPQGAAQPAPALPPATTVGQAGGTAAVEPATPGQSDPPGKGPEAAPQPIPAPVTAPVWVRRPSPQDMAAAQPRRLRSWRRAEIVTIQCRFNARSRPDQCRVIAPSTSDTRFHDWALAIVARYEARPLDESGQAVAGRTIIMPTLEFEPPR